MSRFPAFRTLKLTLASLALTASTAFAAPVDFSGTLSWSDPTFRRPATQGSLSTVGTHVAYDVFNFFVSSDGTYRISTTWFIGDTFLALYQGAFNPASALTNLVAIDDDGGLGNLSQLNVALQADLQYSLVVTSYSNWDYGTYFGNFKTISGGGQVTLGNLPISNPPVEEPGPVEEPAPGQVPEPGTLALLGLALAGMRLMQRRA